MNVGTLYRCSPNSEERRIWTFLEEKAYDFAEVYFDDLRLSKGSIAEKFLWLDYVNGGKEYSLPDSDLPPFYGPGAMLVNSEF